MSKYRRRNLMEEPSNGASGEYPENGAIFMSNSFTRKECLRRELFGLPIGQAGFVKKVKAGMLLFLFEFESRELHGVFQACSDGALNIEPDAFCSSGKQFPAQVKFTEKWRCRPLAERDFRHAISDNYFTPKKFNFGLSRAQVQKLLKLFSLKKVERSPLRKKAAAKPIRKSKSKLGNSAGDRGFRNRLAEETEGDVDREHPFRGTSARDRLGRRSTENHGFRDESDIGVKIEASEYSRDASGVFRRLVDPKMHGSNDRVGYDFSVNNSSGTDDDSDYSLVNGRRVPENLRRTTSGWLKNEYHEKDGITHASARSDHEEHLNFEADSVVPAQSSVPLESLAYGTNPEYYDPCNPGIMGDATMKSSRHDIDEEVIPVGGLDYHIPMPTDHPEYQTSTGMTGVACSESRNGHLRHSQLPGFQTSSGATENMMINSERLSYPSHSIYPSFAYQHQEEFRGHSSCTNDRVARGSRIFPSFAYTSKPGDGVDLYRENRTQNKVQAYQQHEECGGEAFDSDNRVIRVNDRVSPAEFERKRARKSVFTRLGMPIKDRDAKKDSSPVTEPVDEVMAFLNDCQKLLMEQKTPNITDPAKFGKPKEKEEKIHTKEVLGNGLMLPFTETSPDDLLNCEQRLEHSDQTRPFIDFKRRSEAEKSSGSQTQGCKDSLEDLALQDQKRPKLIEDDSEEHRGNNDNAIGNDMASKSASEVRVLDLLGRFGQ